MGLQIESGTGNGKIVHVDDNNRLAVRSESVDSSGLISQRDGQYFIWQSDYDATADDYVMYVKNINPNKILVVRKMYMYNSVACSWEIHRVDSGTASGTEINAENLSFGSGVLSEDEAYGNAAVTGLTTTTQMFSYTKGAGDDNYLDANGAVLINPNNALAVKTTGTGTIKVYLAGYFIPIV